MRRRLFKVTPVFHSVWCRSGPKSGWATFTGSVQFKFFFFLFFLLRETEGEPVAGPVGPITILFHLFLFVFLLFFWWTAGRTGLFGPVLLLLCWSFGSVCVCMYLPSSQPYHRNLKTASSSTRIYARLQNSNCRRAERVPISFLTSFLAYVR
ncbi:hypothetical protein BDW02DRAFT_340104 [Decorospora gaudefroyi]|uniref:Uncharacterized protein n=1 Tax=Decorospora gaudefroyi TaxID=184978 RepID=A0A6A5KFM8_9PLEO|nr:hypothetical protein BDW02DRAFT_340104 [Decorospora gaudefroyi]